MAFKLFQTCRGYVLRARESRSAGVLEVQEVVTRCWAHTCAAQGILGKGVEHDKTCRLGWAPQPQEGFQGCQLTWDSILLQTPLDSSNLVQDTSQILAAILTTHTSILAVSSASGGATDMCLHVHIPAEGSFSKSFGGQQ